MYVPFTFHEKQLVSPCLSYMGGYTGYFTKQVRRLFALGFTYEEMEDACVDDTIREWIANATCVTQTAQGWLLKVCLQGGSAYGDTQSEAPVKA